MIAQLLIESEGGACVAHGRPATRAAAADPCCHECLGNGWHWSPADRRVVLCQCAIDVLDAEDAAGMEAARDEADYKYYHH